MEQLNKSNSLGIRNQIKRQIRMRIEDGDLQAGQAVPSVRNLSSFLNVNRNTVAQAYQELIEEGVLITVKGTGTFVSTSLNGSNRKELYKIINNAIQKAYQLGFDADDITDVLFNCLSMPVDFSSIKILVVECNEPVIEHLCTKITKNLNIKTEGILLQEIEKNSEAYSERFEATPLVVCGFNHVEDVVRIYPWVEDRILAVLLKTDLTVLNAITQVPVGTTIGYICVNQRSAETFYNSAAFSGHKKLNRIIAGLNSTDLLKKITKECDLIFITNFAYETHAIKARPGQKIVLVDITIESATMNLIKKRVMRIVGNRTTHS